jgi:ABC-type sugar transport system substrate-binding protein
MVSLVPEASAQQRPLRKIAFLETSPAHPYMATLHREFQKEADSRGLEVTFFSNAIDPALQTQQVDDAIARKFDLIAIVPSSESAILPALARAKRAGIPVIAVNNVLRSDAEEFYVAFVGQDQHRMGQVAGEAILRALKESGRDGGKIALITGPLAQGAPPRRVAGIREALKANPKADIVAVEDARFDTATSERIAGQLYARFSATGGLDVVYGMADNQALAAIKAAEAAGIAVGIGPKQLIAVGGNCLKEGLASIRAGKEYSTVTQLPAEVAQHTVSAIADHLAGKTLPKQILLTVELVDRASLGKWEQACSY